MSFDHQRYIRRVGDLCRIEPEEPASEAVPEAPTGVGPVLRSEMFRRHVWLLDVLGDLHRYAQRERLDGCAEALRVLGDTLLDDICHQVAPAERTRGSDEGDETPRP